METVIAKFLQKYSSVPRNELIAFIKQVFELSSKTFFEEQEENNKKQTKTKKGKPKEIKKSTEKVSRRHLAEERIASMSCDDLFLETANYCFNSQNDKTLCKIT